MDDPADRYKRTLLLLIIGLGLAATAIAWSVMRGRGPASPSLLIVQGTTAAVLLAMFAAAWWRLLPQRVIGLCCLAFAVAAFLVCMTLRMYAPADSATIELAPLYLWFPAVYVLAFTLNGHRAALYVSLGIMAVFVAVSVPYLVENIHAPYANITIQMHVASAALVATLYFFARYQHRLRLAQVAVDQLARLSSTDELTQLPNRRHMAMAMGAELDRFMRCGEPFAVVLFDVDHFKAVNDRFGHNAGDAALVAVGRHAQELFGGVGTLGRWGGDEFVAIIHGMDAADAERVASALCAHVESSHVLGDLAITISCGITTPRVGDTVDSLLHRADAALYSAKRGGRNRAESMLEPVPKAGLGAGGRVESVRALVR